MLGKIPLLGPYLAIFANVTRYNTVLEDMADFLAADLEKGTRSGGEGEEGSEFVGKKVALVERGMLG